MNYWLLLIPLMSGMLGWLCSWLAGQFLLYRIIPQYKQRVAEQIGKRIKEEFPFRSIEEKITDPATIKNIMPLVEEHIDDFLRNKLKEKMPVISMFIGDKTVSSLKEIFLKEIEELFPQVLKKFAGDIENKMDITGMVIIKITNTSSEQIKKMLNPALTYFQYTGAAAGLLIGLMNVIFFYFLK